MTDAFHTLPEGWVETRLDRVATVTARIGWKALTASEYQSDGYAFLATPNIKNAEIDFTNVNYISEFRYNESPELKLQVGDVLLAKDGNTLGIVNVVHHLPRPATVNGSIAVLRPYGMESRFLRYTIQSSFVQGHINSVKDGMGVPHLFQRDIKRFLLPAPPIEEQRRIASYLDAETARLDRLAALDHRLAALLKERRQAVIDHAVASSSNASTKLFWRLSLLRDGTHQPPPRVDAGVPLLTARNVSSGTLRLTAFDTRVSEGDAEILERSLRLRQGDVLLSVKGTIGACAVTPFDFPRAVLDRNVAVLRPSAGYSSDWLATVLRSTSLQEQMRLAVTAAAQPGLPLGAIRELRIPDVHPDAQSAINRKVRVECAEIDHVLQRLEHKDAVLAERRQALITAAVTGQFDVTTASGRNVTEGVTV
ncbi:restriction endonuclease subunit S [Streptomyces sp. NPDC052051]|uniref:restriction endonuclease subunit S n=1 Tax=Streptomyces sp. NPDC052051 TaxID=3154649 RepID=UPI0034397BBB